MSDSVVNVDSWNGLSVNAQKTEIDKTEKRDKKLKRHAEIDERETEELEKSKNEVGTVKQTMWSVRCFQTWCEEKELDIDFKTLTKAELIQALCQFYATVEKRKRKRTVLSVMFGNVRGSTGRLHQ